HSFAMASVDKPTQQPRGRGSAVWLYFKDVEGKENSAACLACKKEVLRNTGSTGSMRRHIESCHPIQFKELLNTEADRAKPKCKDGPQPLKQQKLSTMFAQANAQEWSDSHPRSVAIDRKILRFIVLDSQPFSVVEGEGFRDLLKEACPQYRLKSTRFYHDKLETLYEEIKLQVQDEIDRLRDFGFTCDLWSDGQLALMSFTIHSITPDFERKQLLLCVKPFTDAHTGLNISAVFSTTLGEWGIGLEQVSLLLRDGASNMKLAGELLKVPSAYCAAHKLNLVVKDSISGHRGLKTILDKARSIVGHFHHSVTAQANLKTLQLQLKLPTHSLVQDVDTRWNSTLAMLRRINEQEEAFSVYRTRHRPIEILMDNESDVSKKAVKLLEIFEVFTLEVSRETASISCILPMVKVSLEHLQQVDCFGITYLRDDLVKGLTQRFSDEKKSHYHIVATMLDPRFRLDFFDEEQRNFAKAELVKAMNEILRETSLPTVDGDTAIDEDLSDVSIETEPQTESQPQQLSMSALFEKSSTSSAAAATLRDLSRAGTLLPVSNRGNAMDKLAREMAAYLSEPRLPFEEDPMKFWRDKTPSTAMSALVRKFLGPPPTSVPSERIFSNVGNIYEPKRRRLLGETVEKLVFINYNVRKFDP
ncbi:hypothetical protein BOX15_Mlig029382g14, partial [Macrostomum lignano]